MRTDLERLTEVVVRQNVTWVFQKILAQRKMRSKYAFDHEVLPGEPFISSIYGSSPSGYYP